MLDHRLDTTREKIMRFTAWFSMVPPYFPRLDSGVRVTVKDLLHWQRFLHPTDSGHSYSSWLQPLAGLFIGSKGVTKQTQGSDLVIWCPGVVPKACPVNSL